MGIGGGAEDESALPDYHVPGAQPPRLIVEERGLFVRAEHDRRAAGAADVVTCRKHRHYRHRIWRLVDSESVAAELPLEVMGEETAVDVAVDRFDAHRARRHMDAGNAAEVGVGRHPAGD